VAAFAAGFGGGCVVAEVVIFLDFGGAFSYWALFVARGPIFLVCAEGWRGWFWGGVGG